MIMLPMIVILIVFAKPIISIMLTDAFMPAYGIFIVFALIAFISAIGTPFSSLIIGMNKPVLSAVIGFIICVSNIIMNFLFIPKNGLLEPFGINGALGAAIATLIAITIGFVCFCLISKRLTGVKILQKNLFVHIIAGLLMGLLLFVINDITVFMSIYKLVIAVAIGFTVYFGLLVAFGEFKTEDLEFFLEICNPKEILKHLRGENKK
jgi:O-antigen/teichoic acid export membrane protein